MKQKLNLLVSLMTTMICPTSLVSVGSPEGKGDSVAIGGQGLTLLLMGAHQTKVLHLNFAHLIRKVRFAVVQVHRALLKASVQALGEILQHLSFGIVH